jgi:2-iminoacetate synthase ThiH
MENTEDSDMDFSDFGQRATLEAEDYYISEEGFIVYTENYHLKRGYCCKNHCKHCPYGYNPKTGKTLK